MTVTKKSSLAEIEERRQELIAERDEKAEQEKTPEQQLQESRELSILDRLKNRGRDEKRTIHLKDPGGDIPLRIVTPTMRVITEYDSIRRKLAGGLKNESEESFEALEDRICHILGDEICTDPEFNYDFWKNGEYDPSLPFEVMGLAINAYNKDVNDGKSFLGNGKGKAARRIVHKNGPHP